MEYEVVTPPTVEPISLEVARGHLLLDAEGSPASHPADTMLEEIYIPGAREHVERFCNRGIATQTLRIKLDAFPSGAIKLPMPPVASITSIEYVGTDEASHTLSSELYVLDSRDSQAWVLPAYDESWPDTLTVANAVTVTYEVGYTTVPAPLKAAILLMLGHLFANRQAVQDKQAYELPHGVMALAHPYRVDLGA